MEYNFFESVIEQKKKTNPTRLIIILVLIIGFGILIIGAVVNLSQFIQIKSEIEHLQGQTGQYSQYLSDLNNAEIYVKQLEDKFLYLYSADFVANANRVVTTELIETLTSLAPGELYLDALDITQLSITMNGNTPDLETLAQFEHNLRNSILFYEPRILMASLLNEAPQFLNDETNEVQEAIVGPYNFRMTVRIASEGAEDAFRELFEDNFGQLKVPEEERGKENE